MRRQPSLTLRSTLAFALVAMLTVSGAGLYLYQSIEETVMQRSDHAVLARLDHFRKLLRYDLTMGNLKGSPQLFENMLDSEEDIFIIGEPGKSPVISVNPQHAPLPELPTVAQDQPLRVDDLRSGMSLSWMFLVAAELIAATKGLGYLLSDGRETSRPDIVLAAIIVLATLGKLSDGLLASLEKRFLAWRDTFNGQSREG
ncbi:Heavy metal sensor kinase [Pseudomonas syringae pv. syringae]|nr:Heavy metal sensor kinase [Pseudomonas syringae pv. syringae]